MNCIPFWVSMNCGCPANCIPGGAIDAIGVSDPMGAIEAIWVIGAIPILAMPPMPLMGPILVNPAIPGIPIPAIPDIGFAWIIKLGCWGFLVYCCFYLLCLFFWFLVSTPKDFEWFWFEFAPSWDLMTWIWGWPWRNCSWDIPEIP